MIRLREITGEENLLQAYVASYARAGGFPLDIGYVRRCRVYAFVDGAGAMAGGFLINTTAPYRSLNDMPEEARQRILALLDLDETFEVMCFWIVPELRGGLPMMRFWAELLYVVWRLPKRDIIGCTVSRSLMKQYSRVPAAELVYEGKIETPTRTLDKYVFLCRGKKGFVRGFASETMHRARELLAPQPVKAPAGAAA
jgi:hypothetical protein